MSPHILFIGGADHALRIPFFDAIQASGFRITAAGTGDRHPFDQAKIAYHPYDFDRFLTIKGHAGAVRRIAQIAKEVCPDIVHSFDTKPNFLVPLAIRTKSPVVRTINGMGWVFSSDERTASVVRPVYCALQRLCSRWTSATVFQNLADREFFQAKHLLGRSTGYLIRGSGIDVFKFAERRTSGEDKETLRAGLGVGTAKIVLTVSRLTKQKGIPTLLKAAAIVCARRADVRFLLVGPRESEGRFAIDQVEIDRHRPYVISTGSRTDIPALLSLADVFAFPSEYREGIPRVLLEAGLAGLPIVTTRMPGCTDLVSEGWNGHLVDPGDHTALAARILELLENEAVARTMGARSIAIVKSDFSMDGVVAQYLDVYARVLRHRTTTHAGMQEISTRSLNRETRATEPVDA